MSNVSKILGYDVKDAEARAAITDMYKIVDFTTPAMGLTRGQVLSEDRAFSTPSGYEPVCS